MLGVGKVSLLKLAHLANETERKERERTVGCSLSVYSELNIYTKEALCKMHSIIFPPAIVFGSLCDVIDRAQNKELRRSGFKSPLS